MANASNSLLECIASRKGRGAEKKLSMANTLKFDPSSDDYTNALKAVTAILLPGRSESIRLESRQELYIQLLAENGLLKRGTTIVDLGGGGTWFTPVLSQMGFDASLVDDFKGGGGVNEDPQRRDLSFIDRFRELGVKVYSQDLLSPPLPFPNESVDVFTFIDALEHLHHSPRRLFAEIQRALRPQGYMLLATPNAVSLRKRIWAVLGLNPSPDFHGWYDPDVFRGHVREPSVRELHRLLELNGLRVVSTCGRNRIGQDSLALSFLPRNLRRVLAQLSESVLRLLPTLCSDIIVVGQRQGKQVS
jgi:SAM-dependent methyltransferase